MSIRPVWLWACLGLTLGCRIPWVHPQLSASQFPKFLLVNKCWQFPDAAGTQHAYWRAFLEIPSRAAARLLHFKLLSHFVLISFSFVGCVLFFFSPLRLEKWHQMLQEKQECGGKPKRSCSRTAWWNAGPRKAASRWAEQHFCTSVWGAVLRFTAILLKPRGLLWILVWKRLFQKVFHNPLAGSSS